MFRHVTFFFVNLQVNARWLTDLDVFNEWMNEEDYELADTDGSVSFDLFFVFLLKYYL